MNIQIHYWAAQCSHYLGDVYDKCRLFHEPKTTLLDEEVRFVAAQLAISCHFASESAFILIVNERLWDAEILIRTILEGSLKYVYILEGTAETQKRRSHEYWHLLPLHAKIIREKRAQSLLSSVPNPDAEEWRPIRDIISGKEEIQEEPTAASERKKLARIWSFSEISKYFATHTDQAMRSLGLFGYSYGTQSHLIHQDGDGVGMRWERMGRSQERQDAITLAHAGRLISDLCSFAFLRGTTLYRACGKKPTPIFKISKRYTDLSDAIKEAERKWQDVEYK